MDRLSEHFIGNWFEKSGNRDRVVLATKVYAPMSDWPNDRGLSARHIIASCEASLHRLRVRYVGSSNFAGWHLSRAQAAADRRHFLGIVSEQCKYNLLTRHAEMEVLPAAQDLGIGILSYSPLHFGALSGALRKQRDGVPGRAVLHAPQRVEPHRAAIQRYERLCSDLGQNPTTIAIAWLLSRPGVTAPVLGPRHSSQLDLPMLAPATRLDEDTLAALDAIFPPIGNGGPAPEAWAW